MFSWSSAIVEATLILAALGALALQASLRATIARAPWGLRMGLGVITIVWLVSQLGEIRVATYPLMSWHMYGESRHDAPVTGYRLLGETCAGRARLIPPSGRELGRRPVLVFGLHRAFDDASRPGASPAARADALARTDSLLALVVDTWNGRSPEMPLCAVDLQQVTVTARDIDRTPLPAYHTVRRFARGR